jgi:hypothetical protein
MEAALDGWLEAAEMRIYALLVSLKD